MKVHDHAIEFGMAEFAGGGRDVGADFDMHRQFLHELAKNINGLNIATYKQDAYPYYRGHDVSADDPLAIARAGASHLTQALRVFPSGRARRRPQMRPL